MTDEVVPDWAMAAARRWTDSMIEGMRSAGFIVRAPSERMYQLCATVLMQVMPKTTVEATERTQEVFAAAHALLIPFEGARWSGPPQTLVMALERLRAAIEKVRT